MNANIDELLPRTRRDFLLECEDDYVGLWSLIRRVRNELPDNKQERFREATIRLIFQLMDGGLIKAGLPTEKGEFIQWKLVTEVTQGLPCLK